MSIQPAGTEYCHGKRIKSSDAKLKSSMLSSRSLLGWLASAGQLLLAHVYVHMLTINHSHTQIFVGLAAPFNTYPLILGDTTVPFTTISAYTY